MNLIEDVQERINQKLEEIKLSNWPKWVRNARQKKKHLVGYIRRFVDECLHPQLPFQLIHQKHGISVVSKTDDFMILKKHLIGRTQVIPEELAEEVVSQQYSSILLNNRGENNILYGPLSFVNHECDSTIHFSLPSNSSIANVKIVDQDVDTPIEKRSVIKSNKEVFVTYCNSEDLWFVCNCKKCIGKISQLYKIIKCHTDYVDRDSLVLADGQNRALRSNMESLPVPNTVSSGYGELTPNSFTNLLLKFQGLN